MPNKWNYSGDIDLRYGGFFWREDGFDDYVLAVDVIPCSDGGGPGNLYDICEGSIYIGDDKARIKSALDCIGAEPETATRDDLVYGMRAYGGIERRRETIIRIGPAEDSSRNGWNPTPDQVLRSTTNLRRYVENNFLD